MKKALITGITVQDGSYLAEFLLEKGYKVHGIKRRASLFNTQRIDHIYEDPHQDQAKLKLHYGDLTDSSNLTRLLRDIEPDEVYNLGAQSHVAVSFESPEYTADVDALGPLRILEAIRILGLEQKTRYYQASTSELYGLVQVIPQRETTPFYPRSPYAVAKPYAYWISVNYRESYGPGDNYDLNTSHVLPALLRKFHEAKINGAQSVTLWGTDAPLREFLHADGLADALIFLLKEYSPDGHINVGSGVEVSIRELAETIAEVVGYEVELVFDSTKPDGTPHKLLYSRRLQDLGWNNARSLKDGLTATYAGWLGGEVSPETKKLNGTR